MDHAQLTESFTQMLDALSKVADRPPVLGRRWSRAGEAPPHQSNQSNQSKPSKL